MSQKLKAMMKLPVFIILLYAFNICDCKSIQPQSDKKPILLDDVIPKNTFGASGFGGSWISASEFTCNSNENLIKYNVNKSTSEILYSKEFSAKWEGASLKISSDESKVLIRYASRSIFRHSTVARFSIMYTNDTEQTEYKIDNGDELQLCEFSPKGNNIIYIKDNTIYYTNDDRIRSFGNSIQISNLGKPGVIYYGIPDWVYEEEVLGSGAAAWFSPNGNYLSFASFNDEKVREFTYEIYGDGKGDFQYPQEVHLRYPKVGATNPSVELWMRDLESLDYYQLNVPDDVVGIDNILGTVFWISNEKLGAIWLNRRQNEGVIVAYTPNSNVDGWDIQQITKLNEPNGWIELDTPKCEDNGICYFINIDNNWPSLIEMNTNNNSLKVLTSNKHVFSYLGSRDGKIYYSATPGPNESFNRHTYVLEKDEETCLTCNIETPEKNNCTYATTSFSTDLSYFALTCSGPDVSFTNIYETDSNDLVKEWQDNKKLRENLEKYELPQTKIFHVTVGEKFNAPVKMQLPAEIDFENPDKVTEKYPLLVKVYGGPGSARVSSSFGLGYNSYQVTSKKIIYVEIDGRGTGQKGAEMMFAVNNKLGTYEIEDQISVTKYLLNKYKFIDKERVSIWGWSYGGYATAMTLAKDVDKVFKCGVAVAPVTSWIFYDTIYTERYMGINESATQYLESDVATPEHIKMIGKHDFMLVHGNADDNVHYQQSMVLARALEKADILFDQLSYPDEAHALSGVLLHLYHSLDRFWDKCFDL